MDLSGKYVRYTNEQVETLERLYHECPKPSSIRRHQLIKDCPTLAHIEPKQIKVWFQNRRCREKQRKESTRLVSVNAKLTALNKLMMEENERLAKHTSQLTLENQFLRQQLQDLAAFPSPDGKCCPVEQVRLQPPKKRLPIVLVGGHDGGDESSTHGGLSMLVHGQAGLASTDTSSDSVITGGLPPHATPQHSPRDPSSAGLLAIAEETLTHFLEKATGTAVDWIQLPGMKPGPDANGIVSISHGGVGIAARVCGLVGLEPSKVATILKDRPCWHRDCRRQDILRALPTGNGGTVELLYTQMYAPTTLASPRDFYTLRYTILLEDGNLVICERSISRVEGGAMLAPVPPFVRAEILPSGYLIRPCEGGGCIIHVVDHVDLEPWSVPEVLRPLYESPTLLAQKTTIGALRHLRRLAQEASGDVGLQSPQQPVVLRALSHRLARGFNEAVNGFVDDGWTAMVSDGMDDVSVMLNATPAPKSTRGQNASDRVLFSLGGGILCAKASMLLQNVPPALLIRFLREHRSEWADYDIDGDAVNAFCSSSHGALTASTGGICHGQLALPLVHSAQQEEFLEIVKLEGHGPIQHRSVLSRDTFLLQLCSGTNESAVGASAQLVFAPVDVAVSDDVPLLPSGFRVIPLDSGVSDGFGLLRTLDLASTLEGGSEGNRLAGNSGSGAAGHLRSVLTIAFQFAFEVHTRDSCAAMARQYVRTVAASVQRVAMALAPSHLTSHVGPPQPPGSPDALVLARRIIESYRVNLGLELARNTTGSNEALFRVFWNHVDAIVCCTWKGLPEFMFANQAGLEMLETTSGGLQDLAWEKTLDENGRKSAYTDFTEVSRQGYACLPAGVRISSRGRTATYDRAFACRVLDDDDSTQCIAFLFLNWSLMT